MKLLILIELNNNEPISIIGSPTSDFHKLIAIYLTRCFNETSGNCYDSEFIEEMIGKFYIKLILDDSYITFGNGRAHVKNSTKVVEEFLSNNVAKTLDVLVRK